MKVWNSARQLIEWIRHHHAPMHENSGVDEINVGGLSGDLADLQDPKDHTHASAGSGVGGQLDWDDIWSDAVHDHSSAGEGQVIPATSVEVSELSTPTPADYDDVQDFINFFGNRTVVDGGGNITDNNDGTAAVSSLVGWCKVSHSDTAVGKFFNWGGGNTPELTDKTTNFIFLDYNQGGAGVPGIVVSTTVNTHGYKQDHIRLGTVYRVGNTLHIVKAQSYIAAPQKFHMHFTEDEGGAHRTGGMVTSDASNRNLSITTGVLYRGIDRSVTLAFNTSRSGTADSNVTNELIDSGGDFVSGDVGKYAYNVDDKTHGTIVTVENSTRITFASDVFPDGNEPYLIDWFTYWYYNFTTSAWVEVEGSTQIDNIQYNIMGSGTGRTNLTVNKYTVAWVYMDFDGHHIEVVYGQDDYTINEAEEAGVPSSLPNVVTNFCTLIAKIILQQNHTPMVISYPWTTPFLTSLATDHDSLGGVDISTAHTTHNTATTGVHGAGGDTIATDADIATAAAALDYGLSFEGIVTDIDDSTHFKVATLTGKGTGFFKPTAGMPYEIYVVEADGAAPEGQQTPVVAYTTADGTFEHASFTTNDLEVDDIVLIIHPLLATLGTKATAAAADAVTTTDYLMAYVKQLVTLLRAVTAAGPTNTQMNTARDAVIAEVDANESKIDNLDGDLVTHDAALTTAKSVIDAIKTILDTPADFKATGFATETKQDIIDGYHDVPVEDVGDDNQMRDVVGKKSDTTGGDSIVALIKILTAAIPAMVGTDNAALASVLEDAMQKATSPSYDQDTDSLEALRELLDTIAGDVANIDGSSIPAMVGTNGAALASSWSAALATILGNFSSTNIGYIDNVNNANLATIADISSLDSTKIGYLANLSAGAVALEGTLTAIKGGGWSDETLKAIKDAIDGLSSGYTHADEKNSFTWNTAGFTTDETDISALFTTPLDIATRRKYAVYLDLTTVEADGSFDELYLAVKKKIDGTNYRAIDRKTVTKANLAATAGPGIIIDIPATSENIQITMKMKTALAGDATIYYAVVKEALE